MKSHFRGSNHLNLGTVPTGQSVCIRAMRGGHEFRSRLASLGFTPGARLTVLRNPGRGPIIVSLRDTRVALGRGEAVKILVDGVVVGSDGH
jgi:Fe2+ transport system protein FeoA